jgi:hypothetical protein
MARHDHGRIYEVVEEAIIERRKWLLDYGLDAGPETIRYHLMHRDLPMVPSKNTIWRVLAAARADQGIAPTRAGARRSRRRGERPMNSS